MPATRIVGSHLLLGLAAVAVTLTGCPGGGDGGSGSDRAFLSMGTAPVGGAFYPVGTALGEVLNNHGDGQWKVTAKATKGTQENIRRLDKGDLQLALANSSITFHATRGIEGFEKQFPVQTVMTLAPNVGHFITLESSGVETIADLKGHRVGIGPSGAGFEYFLRPLLRAHGVDLDEDITAVYNNQSGLVDNLGDGSAKAVFLGGAMPQPSITQACSSLNVKFIPFDEDARQQLIDEYSFFSPITVPAGTYSRLTEDFAGLNVGSMHLVAAARADPELIKQITMTLWENREEVAKRHGVGKAINEKNAARYTGTDFHPGAIAAYQDPTIDIWPKADADATATETPDAEESATGVEGSSEDESSEEDEGDAAEATEEAAP